MVSLSFGCRFCVANVSIDSRHPAVTYMHFNQLWSYTKESSFVTKRSFLDNETEMHLHVDTKLKYLEYS